MGMKLFDSELKVMDVLWKEGDLTAKCIVEILAGQIGWNKNTTYTVIKKCVDKGAIKRREPNFRRVSKVVDTYFSITDKFPHKYRLFNALGNKCVY